MDAKAVLQCIAKVTRLRGELQLEEVKITNTLSQMKKKNCDTYYTENCSELICDYISSLNKRDAIRTEISHHSCMNDIGTFNGASNR